MLKKRIVSIAGMLFLSVGTFAQEDYATRARKYVEQYKDMAVAEQKRSGVPAAITLAQGIHETSAGNSELAVNANNHFGIKCKKSWTGEKYSYTDDAPNECFRKYSSPVESYKDHSDYLSTSARYASLFKLSPTDYASWAIGLKQAGYATNPRYAQVLIRLVEDFKLQEYTYAALDNRHLDKVAEVVPAEDAKPAEKVKEVEPWSKQSGNIRIAELAPEPAAVVLDKPESFPPYGQLVKVNGLKAVYAKKGDMPLEHAIAHNVRYERLLEINEIGDKPLQEDMYLYLERKRFKGTMPAHTVKPGETMAKVAQYEGIQLKYLRSLNHLREGEEPVEGATLYLQDEAPARPEVKGATVATVTPIVNAPVEAVVQPQPESQYVSTEKVQVEEPQVQYAVNKQEVAVIEQPKEIGPVPAPETATPPSPIIAEEPADVLPPAPAEVPVEVKPEEIATVNPPVNIANEKAVEEELAAKAKQLEAQAEAGDELAALKAKFDKVVYAPKATPTAEPVAEPVVEETVVTPEPMKEEPKVTASATRFYTVKKGDTAFNIAKRNNITIKELMDWNNLSFEGIKIGQKLRVKP